MHSRGKRELHPRPKYDTPRTRPREASRRVPRKTNHRCDPLLRGFEPGNGSRIAAWEVAFAMNIATGFGIILDRIGKIVGAAGPTSWTTDFKLRPSDPDPDQQIERESPGLRRRRSSRCRRLRQTRFEYFSTAHILGHLSGRALFTPCARGDSKGPTSRRAPRPSGSGSRSRTRSYGGEDEAALCTGGTGRRTRTRTG
jgi:hypothetical protein